MAGTLTPRLVNQKSTAKLDNPITSTWDLIELAYETL